MKRHGRFITIDTHRTPAQQRELMKRLSEGRPRLREEIVKFTQELTGLIHKFNSLDLWANLVVAVGLKGEQRDCEAPIEHLALLELKDREYQLRGLHMPDGPSIVRAQRLLQQIFQYTIAYYGLEAADPDRTGPPGIEEELRFETLAHELVVRSPGYWSHWADILTGFFGGTWVQSWMRQRLGFDVDASIKCTDSMFRLINKRISERLQQCRDHVAELEGLVKKLKKTGVYEGPPEMKDLVNQIRNMKGKESKRAILALVSSWGTFALSSTLSFTPAEVAEEAGVTQDAAGAFLSMFSTRFGEVADDYLLPEPTSRLRDHPIIKYEDKFMCPGPHLVLGAIKPRLEAELQRDPAPRSKTSPWDKYQKHRGAFLVAETLKCFDRLLPTAQVYDGLKYSVTEQGVPKKVELDALVQFDRYAFLIECKAGTFGPSGRRGGSRMVEDLRKLLADPHRQAVRARQYIWETEKPSFTTATGVQVHVDKSQFTALACVTVHLEQLDVFTVTLARTAGLGIFHRKELAWAVYLPDLRVVSEMIQLSSQFLHYLKWRLQLNRFPGIHSSDELGWLGYYFAEGPKDLEMPAGYQMMDVLPDYVHRFDQYYHAVDNSGQKPATKPDAGLSPKMKELLAAVTFTGRYGHTRVAEALLDLAFPDRVQLENAVLAFAPNIGSREPRTLSFKGPTAVVQLRTVGTSWEDCKAEASTLSARFGGTAVVLGVDSIAPLQVAAWGIHE